VKRFDFILFDADNTLFDYDRAERHALTTTLRELGAEASEAVHRTYRRINADYWRRFENGTVTAADLRSGRFADLAAEIGLDIAGEQMSSRYLRHLGQASFLIDGAQSVVEELSRRGFLLGLITNGLEDVQKSRLSLSPIAEYFSSVTISDEVGAKKPDPKIFEIAFSRSGNPDKSRSLVVGDSLTSDMAGGRNFGIATCWYNPEGNPAPQDSPPDYEISALHHIFDLM
jgi:2-haloacid dehalogenase